MAKPRKLGKSPSSIGLGENSIYLIFEICNFCFALDDQEEHRTTGELYIIIYKEYVYQNGQINKIQSNIKYLGFRLKKDFKKLTHNIKAMKDFYLKDLFCAKIHNECVQCLCSLCSTEHTAGLQKLWNPLILDRRTWSKLGEHGGHGQHGKGGKHQPDDLKDSTCDSKHFICDTKHFLSTK